MEIITNSLKETQQIARKLAQKIIKKSPKKALVIALKGELGAGKTVFIKGFSDFFKIKESILSPTFVIIHKHNIKNKIKNIKFKTLYHIDAYRLKSHRDLEKLKIDDILDNPKNIVMIEWADRVKKVIPKEAIWIKIRHLDKEKRELIIT